MKAFLFNSDIERLINIKAGLKKYEEGCDPYNITLSLSVMADPDRPTEASTIELSAIDKSTDYNLSIYFPIWTPVPTVIKLAETLVNEAIDRKVKKG